MPVEGVFISVVYGCMIKVGIMIETSIKILLIILKGLQNVRAGVILKES